MRAQIVRHFRKYGSEEHKAWQAGLLQHILREPMQLVRHSTAELIAVIGKMPYLYFIQNIFPQHTIFSRQSRI